MHFCNISVVCVGVVRILFSPVAILVFHTERHILANFGVRRLLWVTSSQKTRFLLRKNASYRTFLCKTCNNSSCFRNNNKHLGLKKEICPVSLSSNFQNNARPQTHITRILLFYQKHESFLG